MRIQGIMDRARGNKFQALQLAQQMANKITDAAKAGRRAMAAVDMNMHDVARIFFRREAQLSL